MTYNKVYDKIYVTNNYNMFSFKGGNRDILRNESHIRNLQQELKRKQLASIPLSVEYENGRYYINEGQNRFEALRREKLPIYYAIERKKINIDDIRRLNNTQKSWNQKDWVDSYIHSEKENFGPFKAVSQPYHMYKHFMTKYKVTSSVALYLLAGENNKSTTKRFRDGQLKIPDWNKSCEKINFLQSMEIYINKNWKRSSFVTAMMSAYNDYRFRKKRWMRKLELNSRKIVLATNALDYMDMINEVYNFKETQKVYFELKNAKNIKSSLRRNGHDAFWNY